MKKSDISTGDVLYLNSGSPALTVTAFAGGEEIRVSWITDDGKCLSSTFPAACLTEDTAG